MTTLNELRITVEPEGIQVQLYKYPVNFTGKNYVPVRIHLLPPEEQKNYVTGLMCRVKASEVMQVRKTARWDSAGYITRSIYFLEGQIEEARKLVKDDLEKKIQQMKLEVDAIHSAWVNKTMRPRRTPEKNFPSHTADGLEDKA